MTAKRNPAENFKQIARRHAQRWTAVQGAAVPCTTCPEHRRCATKHLACQAYARVLSQSEGHVEKTESGERKATGARTPTREGYEDVFIAPLERELKRLEAIPSGRRTHEEHEAIRACREAIAEEHRRLRTTTVAVAA